MYVTLNCDNFMCVCMCDFLLEYVYAHVCICVYACAHVYMCMYVHGYVCVFVCLCVCVCMCVCACMCVCVCVCNVTHQYYNYYVCSYSYHIILLSVTVNKQIKEFTISYGLLDNPIFNLNQIQLDLEVHR